MPACGVKYPPVPKTGRRSDAALPTPSSADGGIRVIFGRARNLVYPPTGWCPTPADTRLPEQQLRREYVYGYNGACRASIHFISEIECVFPVASLVVVQSLGDDNSQRFFEGHDNDVTCLHWNEKRRICCSGQADPKGVGGPFICVWTPEHISETICELHYHEKSVAAVAFSADGQIIVSFGADDAHTLCVWRDFAHWDGLSGPHPSLGPTSGGQDVSSTRQHRAPLYHVSSGRQLTRSLIVGPSTATPRTETFYTFGERHFKCWTLMLGKEIEIKDRRGIFGKAAVPRNPTCIAFLTDEGKALMSGDNGHVYTLTGSAVMQDKRIVPPHSPVPLGCIAALPGGRWVAGSGDGTIYIGSSDPLPRVEERFSIAEVAGSEGQLFCTTATARLASIAVRGTMALFGTSNHALVLVDLERRETLRVLQVSHAEEAWAMDFHPSLAILATASVAKDVRFWNVAERRPAVGKILRASQRVWSLAFAPDGGLLALGGDGGIEVHAFPSLQPVFKQIVSQSGERFSDLRFSDDGTLLGAACWDQMVYLLRVFSSPVGVRLHRVLSGNTSSPVCLIFSASGEYVMSNSKDTQILFWRTSDGDRQKATSAFRDTRWQNPWTCILGWQVVGAWGDPEYSSCALNSICQSSPPNEGYMALGDDFGKVKLLRFPNPFPNPPCYTYCGHASFVTKVKFSRANVLVSLGGDDHSISQWVFRGRERERQGLQQLVVHPWTQLGEKEGLRDNFGHLGRSNRIDPAPAEPLAHRDEYDATSDKIDHGSPRPEDQQPGRDGGTRPPRRPASASVGRRRPPSLARGSVVSGAPSNHVPSGQMVTDEVISDALPAPALGRQSRIRSSSAPRAQGRRESDDFVPPDRKCHLQSRNRSDRVANALRWD